MSFRLDDIQLEYRKTLRSLCAAKIEPNAAKADSTASFPWESWNALVESDVTGLALPEVYGGQGADLLTWAVAVEEVARACASTAVTLVVNAGAALLIDLLGTDEQRQRWIPAAATGESILAFAQSEAHAGSDVAAISTRAVRDGDDWVISGHKTWISSAGIASGYLVFAKTTPDAGAKGISLFLVDADADGLSVGKFEDKMGLRGSPTGELILDDVRVPGGALLGECDRGFVSSMAFLDRSRPLVGAQAVGVAAAALDAAVVYAKERKAFGRRIADFQGLQFMLADAEIGVETARSMVHRAASLLDNPTPDDIDPTTAASIAKTYASDVAMRVTIDAVQVFGGAGYVKDFPVERLMRDAKVFQIYEGTNQIQRWIIARKLVGR